MHPRIRSIAQIFDQPNKDTPFVSWIVPTEEDKELPVLPPSPPQTPQRITRSKKNGKSTRFLLPPPLVLVEESPAVTKSVSSTLFNTKIVFLLFLALFLVGSSLSLYAFYTIPFDVAICSDLNYFSYFIHWVRLLGAFECRDETAFEIAWHKLIEFFA